MTIELIRDYVYTDDESPVVEAVVRLDTHPMVGDQYVVSGVVFEVVRRRFILDRAEWQYLVKQITPADAGKD